MLALIGRGLSNTEIAEALVRRARPRRRPTSAGSCQARRPRPGPAGGHRLRDRPRHPWRARRGVAPAYSRSTARTPRGRRRSPPAADDRDAGSARWVDDHRAGTPATDRGPPCHCSRRTRSRRTAPAGSRTRRPAPLAARAVDAVKVYGKGDTAVRALDGVDVELRRRRLHRHHGPLGLGQVDADARLAGLDDLTSGHVFIGDTDLTTLADKGSPRCAATGSASCSRPSTWCRRSTAIENITLPMASPAASPTSEWLDLVIDTVGLGSRLKHRPSELSGGQQQRVAVARALAGQPEIIFADEPTGNLDSRSGAEILAFMRQAVRELGQTIVMVTHDPVAASYADRVVFLADGRIVDEILDPTADAVLDRMKTLEDSGSLSMFRLTIKGLWAHKLRFALTGLAVVLGVAFMVGTMVLTDTMEKTFDDLFAVGQRRHRRHRPAARRHRRRARRPSGSASSRAVDQVRGRRRRRRRRRHRPGLRPAGARPTARSPRTDGLGVTIGANWVDDDRSTRSTSPSGRAPEAADEVVIDRSTAEREGWALGDTFTVLTKGGPRELTLVGTATYGDLERHAGLVAGRHRPTPPPSGSSPSRAATTAIVVAGGRRRRPGRRCVADDRPRPRRRHLEVHHRRGRHRRRAGQFQEDLSFFNQFLMAFAYVALFVGHVHHLQHLLDRRRPAEAGPGHAAGHRRPPPPGAALGAARVGRRRPGRRGHRPGRRRRAVVRAAGAARAPSASTSPPGDLVVSTAHDRHRLRGRRDVTRRSRRWPRPSGPAGSAHRRPARRRRRPLRPRRSGGPSAARCVTGAGVAAFAAGLVGRGRRRHPAHRPRRADRRARRVRPRPGASPARSSPLLGWPLRRLFGATGAASPGRTPAATPSAPPPPPRR